MPDREKVINALQQCVGYEDDDNKYTCIYDGDINPNCPYGGTGGDGVSCMTKMMRDALALLEAQEPREMSDAELMDAIRKAPIIVKPAVDAAPVVHARWIDECCSNCGTYVYHGDADNYCPHCGAKMDKED